MTKKRARSAILAGALTLSMVCSMLPAAASGTTEETTTSTQAPFTDVSESAWFSEAVTYVWENDMMNGVGNNEFDPDGEVTRGMMVQVIYNISGSTETPSGSFTDVAPDAWYANAVNWAASEGIVTGYGDGKFGPEDAVTREQIALMLHNYAEYAGMDVRAEGDITKFSDCWDTSSWALHGMEWAVGTGLFNGDDNGKLNPGANATRAQLAKILMCYDINVLPIVEDEATSSAFATVEGGILMGTKSDGTYIFKGIPYAQAERFQMPEKPDSWNGIRSAMVYGESAPYGGTTVTVTDYMTPSGTNYVPSEDCQFLNVWTQSLDTSAKKPVIFWIHGGGWSSGSSNELSYYDGQNLSVSQDVVFVSINHRLNVLGYTDLSAYGEEYENSGNVGVADIVMALEWVRDNIEQFGGDPDNVTIIGQSGGGAKVEVLMGVPAAQGLFSKAIMMSGSGVGTDSATAEAAGQALVEKTKTTYSVTTDEEALEILKTISYDELSSLASGTGVGAGAVYGTEYYPVPTIDADGNLVESAKNIPVIVTCTFAEMAGNIDDLTIAPLIAGASGGYGGPTVTPEEYLAKNSKDYITDEMAQQMLEEKFGENTETILEEFRKAYPGHDDIDVLWLNTGSLGTGGLKVLNVMSEQSNANVYRAVFAYEFPIFGGVLAWHTGGDLPFVFNNLDKIEHMVAGDAAAAQKLADEASTAFCNFARTGDPSQDGLAWEAFTTEGGAAMIFDHTSEVRYHHDNQLLAYLA